MRALLPTILSALLLGCSNDPPIAFNCSGQGMLLTDAELRWASKTFQFHEADGVYRTYRDRDNDDSYALFDIVLNKLWIYSKKEFSSGKWDAGVRSDCVKV